METKSEYTDLCAMNKWQIEHIKKGIKQADKGEFASAAEVMKAFASWRNNQPAI